MTKNASGLIIGGTKATITRKPYRRKEKTTMKTAKLETERYLVRVNLTDKKVEVYDKKLNDTYHGEYEPSTLYPGRLTVKAHSHIAMIRCAEFLAFIEAADDAAGGE